MSVDTGVPTGRPVADAPRPEPLPSTHLADYEVSVPRYSEYRPATSPDSPPPPASATKPFKPTKGRFLIGAVMLSVCAAATYTVWNSFVRNWTYGIVEGHVVDVMPPWDGEVRHVHVREGDRIEPGETLVTLDNPDLRQRLLRLEEDLRVARATFSAESARLDWQGELDADRHQKAMAEYYEAWGTLLSERAQLDLTARRLARAKELARKNTIVGDDLDSARLAESGQRQKVDKLAAAVAEMRRRAEAQPRSREQTKSQVEPHLLRIEALQAEISRCNEELAKGRIAAPVSGIVIKRECLAGDHADASKPVILLLEEGSAEVVLYVSQQGAHSIANGQILHVEIQPRSTLIACKVVRVGQRFQSAPKPIERHYRAAEHLLPVYLRPEERPSSDIDSFLGAVVVVPRSWWPTETPVTRRKE